MRGQFSRRTRRLVLASLLLAMAVVGVMLLVLQEYPDPAILNTHEADPEQQARVDAQVNRDRDIDGSF